MNKAIIRKLEKATDLVLLLTAIAGAILYYPKMASFFVGKESMNAYQIFWNICLGFAIFNVYLLVVVLVFRLKGRLDKWFREE